MPTSRSSKKSLRKSRARNAHNRDVRSAVRTSLRRVRTALAGGDAAAATAAFRACLSTIDKAAKRGIVHPNTARRHQSRLAKRLQGLGAKKS